MKKLMFLILLSCSTFAVQEVPEVEPTTQEEVYDFINALRYWVPKSERSVEEWLDR